MRRGRATPEVAARELGLERPAGRPGLGSERRHRDRPPSGNRRWRQPGREKWCEEAVL